MKKAIIWTAELDARMTELHAGGASFRDVATTLEREFYMTITRNAVVGRAFRIGLPVRKPPVVKKRSPKPREPRRQMLKIWVDDPVLLLSPALTPVLGELGILDLTSDTCRWPEGERPPYKYCGVAVHGGGSFCKTHYDRAYVSPSKVWR